MHVTRVKFAPSNASTAWTIPLLQITGCCTAGSSSGASPVIVGGATLFVVIVTAVAFVSC